MKSQRKSNREKAGIIAGLERKIHNLEVKCGSLAAENRKLKKELEKYKEKKPQKLSTTMRYTEDRMPTDEECAIVGRELMRFIEDPYYLERQLWRELTGEKKENEHTGDVQ